MMDPQVLITIISAVNTVALAVLGFLTVLIKRERKPMSQEERDLLLKIRTNVASIKEDQVQERDERREELREERERRRDLERRFNEHLAYTHSGR